MASSVSGGLFDDLYLLYMAIAVVVGGAVIAWLLTSLIRFRARPGMPRPRDAPVAGVQPAERGHPMWSYVMAGLIALIMFGLAFSTIGAINTIETPPEEEGRVHVTVTGYQFGWRYEYEGAGGIPVELNLFGGASDKFVVPKDRAVLLNITSVDVWHNFAIPDFRLRVDAIPGTVNKIWFRATETGDFRNVCVQICGLNHANMHSVMSVVTPEEFDAWLADASESEYDRLTTSYLRTPTRGSVLNATLSGDGLELTGNYTSGRPVILNFANDFSTPTTVTVGGRSYSAAGSAVTRLFIAEPPAGPLEVAAGGQTATTQEAQG